MKIKILVVFFLCLFFSITTLLYAQETIKNSGQKKHRFTVYAGMGPSFYLNNLAVSAQYVREWNFAFVTRFMWEPEHFLSLGFETGYNGLYSIKETDANGNQVKISNAAIPIQAVISMKFLQHFYGTFTMGQSVLLNHVSSKTPASSITENATSFSLGDFGLAAGYRKSISPRVFIGGELKGFYSSKLDDKNIGLIFMTGYRL